MPAPEFDVDILHQTRPSFIACLEQNPARAFREFYTFAWKILRAFPPPALRTLRADDRDDLIAEIILHCVKDDMRVLRRYDDLGYPFANWLLVVAQFRAIDLLRRPSSPWRPTVRLDPGGPAGGPSPPRDRGTLPDELAISRKNLELVMSIVREMAPQDQIILIASAEGYPPRDLVRLLGRPPEDAKKVSDSVRYCRRRLKKLLKTRAGLDWRELTGGGVSPTQTAH